MGELTQSVAGRNTTSYMLAISAYLIVSTVSGIALFGKLPLLVRVVHLPTAILTAVVAIWASLPLLWRFALRFRRVLAAAVLVGVAISSLVIFPRMSELKATGRGSDQPDCVIVAAKRLASHSWPYDHTQMWSRTPMSCGPGWVALQIPVIITVGYRWNLLILWALALFLMRISLQPDTIAGLLSLMGLAAVTWVTACDGTDFLPYGLLICGLMMALDTSSRYDILWFALLACVIQFRFPMLIVPVLLLPFWRLRAAVSVSLIGFICYIGFLLWNPSLYVSDGPLHLFSKVIGERVLSSNRWTVALEVVLIFAVMLTLAVVARRMIADRWLAVWYLFALAAVPAVIDLNAKYHLYGSALFALGIWEGVNWLSGCLPLVALYLLASTGELTYLEPGRSSGRVRHLDNLRVHSDAG